MSVVSVIPYEFLQRKYSSRTDENKFLSSVEMTNLFGCVELPAFSSQFAWNALSYVSEVARNPKYFLRFICCTCKEVIFIPVCLYKEGIFEIWLRTLISAYVLMFEYGKSSFRRNPKPSWESSSCISSGSFKTFISTYADPIGGVYRRSLVEDEKIKFYLFNMTHTLQSSCKGTYWNLEDDRLKDSNLNYMQK